MFSRLSLLACASIAVAAALTGAPAQAASVVLWPVDPVIAKGENATALWLENKGNEPVTLQVRSVGWSQTGGADSYGDQAEVVVSPPIATVPAGARQLVRIIRRVPGTGSAEHSYRLLIDELPPVFDPNRKEAPTAQLGVQMRYSIPLFTYDGDAASATPRLSARLEATQDKRYLVISNNGAHNARLLDLRTAAAGQNAMLVPGLMGYVLAGQTVRFALPANTPWQSDFRVNVNGVDQSLAPSA